MTFFPVCRGHIPIRVDVQLGSPFVIYEKPTKKAFEVFLNHFKELKLDGAFYPLVRPGDRVSFHDSLVRLDNEKKNRKLPLFQSSTPAKPRWKRPASKHENNRGESHY